MSDSPPPRVQSVPLLPYPQAATVSSPVTPKTSNTSAATVWQGVWQGKKDARVEQRLLELLPEGIGRPLTVAVDDIDSGYPQLGLNESYRLQIAPEGVALQAASTWGALHGVTSLWQMVTCGGLPVAGEIIDHPRFAWRGVLIDVARHFMPMPLLHRVVEGLAHLKLNVLHLHLTDDQGFRLQSRHFPKLASAQSYSAAELRELMDHAARLGVRVVPEVDVPGHVHSWLVAYPQWGLAEVSPTEKFGVHQACLNPTDDAVYDALAVLFAEVADIFADDYIHIGGDEVHPAWWSTATTVQEYMQQHKLADVRALQTHFNQRLCAVLQAQGKKVVAWDEVLHSDMPELLVQNWRGATTRDRALVAGRDCIVSAPYYLDLFYSAGLHYGFDAEAEQTVWLAAEDAMRKETELAHVAQGLAWTDQWRKDAVNLGPGPRQAAVLGGEACLWSELVDADTLEVRLFSRLPAVAERLWSAADVTDIDQFYHRLEQVLTLPGLHILARQRAQLAALGLSTTQIAAAEYLEPVKWYARLLGAQALEARIAGEEMPQARPYQVHTPLNRVVDYISPESLTARRLLQLEGAEVRNLCEEWRAIQPDTWPRDAQAAAHTLKQLGEWMVTVLNQGIAAHSPAQLETWRQELLAMYRPQGEYMVAAVPWLLRWLEVWMADERRR